MENTLLSAPISDPLAAYNLFLSTRGNRDLVFRGVLKEFQPQALQIFEIGTIRSDKLECRQGDGWATFHFATYVNTYGGQLVCCDINENTLKLARSIVLPKFPKVAFHHTRAENILSQNIAWDLIYLDGSDDPYEALAYFELCQKRTRFILVDDFTSKGTLIRAKYPDYFSFTWENNPHEMAFYGAKKGGVTLPIIQ